MTHPAEEPRKVFYKVFVRDGARCGYCDTSVISSYDAFSASNLDHLKPSDCGGADHDVWNRVTACAVCTNLKGAFDPSPDEAVTSANFAACVLRVREYVRDKRKEATSNGYFRDYHYWRNVLALETH